MKHSFFRTVSLFLLVSLIITGCAQGITVSEASNFKAKPRDGMSRIVVYRTQKLYAAANQPKVFLDGKETGRCKPNGVFFIDVPKGKHEISVTTEFKKKMVINTTNVNIAYVRCNIGVGLVVGHPILKKRSVAQGETETAQLSFTGTY